jgi:hypothetical protein
MAQPPRTPTPTTNKKGVARVLDVVDQTVKNANIVLIE